MAWPSIAIMVTRYSVFKLHPYCCDMFTIFMFSVIKDNFIFSVIKDNLIVNQYAPPPCLIKIIITVGYIFGNHFHFKVLFLSLKSMTAVTNNTRTFHTVL